MAISRAASSSDSRHIAASGQLAGDILDVKDRYSGKNLPNAMSVDVEDYFQVSAFETVIARDAWASVPVRLHRNIDKILDIFSSRDVRGTFFVLGWVARKFPQIVRDICQAGHEIASHGTDHSRLHTLTPDEFRRDIANSRKVLEDVSGTPVLGYRAPSFSIDMETIWALDVLS